ncbi:cilia- and flagella-associated protein 184 [Denticeps clupeoides]|uniref:cilia- and flagella-associated protein 184 n=1 Tax=Denticeps clupeoides TaxID=299321 RepID=UPI0010A424C6|nr:coiled-coil domain-containing protein 96 [Denticeps clupeoides]
MVLTVRYRAGLRFSELHRTFSRSESSSKPVRFSMAENSPSLPSSLIAMPAPPPGPMPPPLPPPPPPPPAPPPPPTPPPLLPLLEPATLLFSLRFSRLCRAASYSADSSRRVMPLRRYRWSSRTLARRARSLCMFSKNSSNSRCAMHWQSARSLALSSFSSFVIFLFGAEDDTVTVGPPASEGAAAVAPPSAPLPPILHKEDRNKVVVACDVLAPLPFSELPNVHVHVGALQLDLHVLVVVVHRQAADELLCILVILNLVVIPERHVAQLLLLRNRHIQRRQRRGQARRQRAATWTISKAILLDGIEERLLFPARPSSLRCGTPQSKTPAVHLLITVPSPVIADLRARREALGTQLDVLALRAAQPQEFQDHLEILLLGAQTMEGDKREQTNVESELDIGHHQDAVLNAVAEAEDAFISEKMEENEISPEEGKQSIDISTEGPKFDDVPHEDSGTETVGNAEIPSSEERKGAASEPSTSQTHSYEEIMNGIDEFGLEQDKDSPTTQEFSRAASPVEKHQVRLKDQDEDEVTNTDHKEHADLLAELQAERDKLMEQNNHLQIRLLEFFCQRKDNGPWAEWEKPVQEPEQQYKEYLETIVELKDQYHRRSEQYQQQLEGLRAQTMEKLGQVEDEWRAFMALKHEVAVAALSRQVGKQAARDEVEQILAVEERWEKQLVSVRLENIKLEDTLRKFEALVHKEVLGEGRHVADFEQLKLENHTYSEKIEERKDELSSLHKKIASKVQVLTHVREKLQFVRMENQIGRTELAEVEAALAQKREMLMLTKQARDRLRMDNLKLRQRCGLLGNKMLLRDFEEKVDENRQMEERLEMLKRRHAELTMKSDRIKKNLEQSRSQMV